MGLRDLQLPTSTVSTPGGNFDVRGISFSDVMVVANTFGPQAAMVFAKLTNGQKVQVDDVKSVLANIAPQVPELVAGVIALAADDYSPEGIAMAGKLNFHVQLDALEKIFHNTFQSEAELKKFMESIIRMITGATGVLDQMRLPLSEAGFGASGGK
jgi:hypothetical protein